MEMSDCLLCVFVNACLSPNNPFQFPGECFSLICRFKTILLALCGERWIWIACPPHPMRIHWQKIFFFFSFGNQQLNILPIFFYLLPSTKCHQMCKMPPRQGRSRGFFPPTTPRLFPFCYNNLNIFGFFFPFSGYSYPPISFFRWLHRLIKNNKKRNPQRTQLHPPSVMFSSLAEIKMSQRVSEKGMS